MTPDPKELLAFKQALSHTPVDVIARKLNDNVILRTWKRELAEAEITRRGGVKSASKTSVHAKLSHWSRAQMASWLVAAALVALIVAIGLLTIYM